MPAANAIRRASGVPDGHDGDDAEESGRRGTAREENGRLPAPVDELSEQWPADAERHGVRRRDEARGGERAGQVNGVDEQSDAEHHERHARDDRDGQEAPRAGCGCESFHDPDGAGELGHIPDPQIALNPIPVVAPWSRLGYSRRLRTSMPDVLTTGSVVAGYRVVRLIGRGATGAVYLAEDAAGRARSR